VAIRSWIAQAGADPSPAEYPLSKAPGAAATIDDHADAAAMGFAPSRYTEPGAPKMFATKAICGKTARRSNRRPDAKRILIVPPKRLGRDASGTENPRGSTSDLTPPRLSGPCLRRALALIFIQNLFAQAQILRRGFDILSPNVFKRALKRQFQGRIELNALAISCERML